MAKETGDVIHCATHVTIEKTKVQQDPYIAISSGVRLIEHNGVLIIHNGKFVKSD